MDRKDDSKKAVLKEKTVVTYVAVPPDGGWGWVIVAASFFISFIADGVMYSTGIFVGRIDESLKVSSGSVALIGSLYGGFSLLAGPFVSALTNRYGFRTVSIVGSIVTCLSFVASSVTNSINLMCFTFGVLGGIGYGMIYIPSLIIIGFYFERWRSLATCMALCGSGIGTFVVPPLLIYLMDNYGWRSTILLEAGLILNCAVFGSLFRPLMPVQVQVPCDAACTSDDDEAEGTDDNTQPLIEHIKHDREGMRQADSKLSFDNEVSITAQPPSDIKSFLKAGHNLKYATIHDVLNDSYFPVQKIFHTSNSSISKSKEISTKERGRFKVVSCEDKKLKGHYFTKSNSRNKLQTIESEKCDVQGDETLAKQLKRMTSTQKITGAVFESSNTRRDSIAVRYHPRGEGYPEMSKRLQSRRATISSGMRPFYRDDIFFQASLSRLPQYSSRASGLEYTLAVTRLPTFNDVMEEETSQCTLFPEAVQRTLATMLDVNLLSSPSFLLLCFGGFFASMGAYVPFMYLESRAKSAEMDPNFSKWLISTIGIFSTIGRISCGVVTSFPKANALLINNIAMSVGGVATALSGLSMSPIFQLSFSAVFGFCFAIMWSLRTIITVDLIGLENLSNGFGLILLFHGVAAIIGAPLAGFVMEIVHDHNINFILAGGMIFLSGVVGFPLKWIKNMEKEQKPKTVLNGDIQDQNV